MISAAILTLSVILCACGKKDPVKNETTAAETATTGEAVTAAEQTEIITEAATYVDESGYHVVSYYVATSENDAQAHSYTLAEPPSQKNELTYKTETLPNPQNQSGNQSVAPENTTQARKPVATQAATTETVTEKPTQPVTVPEKANGLSILFKSNSVSKGSDASITVNGENGKEYTVEVYRNANGEKLTSDSLKPVKADENGFVSWSFSTANCDKGYRKIIIRENNSDKYIQTSILVV